MEITPGRAPFTEDEDYTPLRKPKSATSTPTHVQHGGYVSQQQQQQQQQQQYQQQQQLHQDEHHEQYQQMQRQLAGIHINNAVGGYFAGPGGSEATAVAYSAGGVGGGGGALRPTQALSANAKEFVPRYSGNTNAAQERLEQQLRHQQRYNQQQYQQYQQPQRQQPQRYMNGGGGGGGYQQHQQQQQQQQQQYSTQANSLTGSIQERLKIGAGGGGGGGSGGGGGGSSNKNNSGNYYQNQSRHHNHNKNNHQHHHNQQQHNHHGHQQRYNQQLQQHHHGSSSQQQQQQQHNSSTPSSSEVETIALDYLQTVIQCLNQNPGQFDSIATRFLTIFDGMENNQYVLSNAMEDIFQESILNPNFRYMGAKLYNLLHMLNLKRDSLFHTLLKCKLDYHQQEVVQFMQSGQQSKVRETALFLAELYMQLRGDDSRIHLIAENIVYSLKQLLTSGGELLEDQMRCICQTLKLAGYDLTADCGTEMQDIIGMLDGIDGASQGKYPMLANVIQLQRNNWGRKVSASNSLCDPETVKPPEPLRTSDEPIFYGPDGKEISAEESAFLEKVGLGMGGSTDEEDVNDFDVDLDPEMDEETERAYKVFCKQANASA